MAQYKLNNVLKSAESKIYNLSDDIVDGIQIYILPTVLSVSVSGFNEVTNRYQWLLNPKQDNSHKISAVIDGVSYPIKKGVAGESSTNPIIFRRTSSPRVLSLNKNNIPNTNIYPLYGNDSTSVLADWQKLINVGDISESTINSLPSSGNVELNMEYFNNHLSNTNESDYITFNVTINETVGTQLYNLIVQQLLNCTFVIHDAIFEKKLTSALELLNGANYYAYTQQELGVRF